MPACGILQVSNPGRYAPRDGRPSLVYDQLLEIESAYLRGVARERAGSLDLADPVVTLERAHAFERPLPKFLVTCGARDVLIDDARRLEAALARRRAVCEARYYADEPHAFHAFVFREGAKRWWRDTFGFLADQMSAAPASSRRA